MSTTTNLTAVQALILIAQRQDFIPMTEADLAMFGGCESAQPMISYGVVVHGVGEGPVIIVDGERVCILHDADDSPAAGDVDAQYFDFKAPAMIAAPAAAPVPGPVCECFGFNCGGKGPHGEGDEDVCAAPATKVYKCDGMKVVLCDACGAEWAADGGDWTVDTTDEVAK